jgi:hypothetical protein
MVKVALKGGGEEVWGLLGFVAIVCIRLYFCFCSLRCLCHGFQGAGGVYGWYNRLVFGW